MATTPVTNVPSEVASLPGADFASFWEGAPPHRTVFGVDRSIIDSDARVYAAAIQLADGTVDDGTIEAPCL